MKKAVGCIGFFLFRQSHAPSPLPLPLLSSGQSGRQKYRRKGRLK